jgi:outer membrane biosynthesis protein TonB
MNPRTIQLLCVCFALAFSSAVQAAPTSEKPELQAWQKKVFDTIGTRWYRELEVKAGLVTVGTARFSFRIMPDGHIKNLRLVSNTSNEPFANICIQAINGAKLPPIPQSVLKEANQKSIDFDIPFTIFP